jgi:mono/diheme cytochrome c family protein
MSTQNPQLQPPEKLPKNSSLQPDAPDFVETPDAAPVSPAEHEKLPLWLYLICGAALFLAGSSFTGFGTSVYDQGSGLAIVATSSGPAAPTGPVDPMVLGKTVYSGNCANCHQASGEGQPGSYPPLVNSEWVMGDKDLVAAILLHGVAGPLTVESGSYDGQMPPWSTALTDEKIAAVITYIRGSWGNKGGPISVADVTAARAKFAAQADTFTQAQLMKMAPKK